MLLTAGEIILILDMIEEKHGFGYSKEPEVAKLQAKLSIMMEAKARTWKEIANEELKVHGRPVTLQEVREMNEPHKEKIIAALDEERGQG